MIELTNQFSYTYIRSEKGVVNPLLKAYSRVKVKIQVSCRAENSKECASSSRPLHLRVSVKRFYFSASHCKYDPGCSPVTPFRLAHQSTMAGSMHMSLTTAFGYAILRNCLETSIHAISRTLGRLNSIPTSFRLYLHFPLSWQFAYLLVVFFGLFFLIGLYGLPLSPKNSTSRGSWLAQTLNCGRHAARPLYLDFSLLGLCYAW